MAGPPALGVQVEGAVGPDAPQRLLQAAVVAVGWAGQGQIAEAAHGVVSGLGPGSVGRWRETGMASLMRGKEGAPPAAGQTPTVGARLGHADTQQTDPELADEFPSP